MRFTNILDRLGNAVVHAPARSKAWTALVASLCAIASLVLMFALAMTHDLNHDEHQFIASAVLLLRESLLPYRDYAYFHVPNLVFVYAALFSVTDHLLLAARLFSALCAWLTLVVVFICAWRAGARFGARGRVLFAAACSFLLLGMPLFMYTSVIAWNHAAATLCALLAFCAHVRASRRGSAAWAMASGLLLGLATGTRLSFAPLFLPFGLVALLPPPAGTSRVRLAAGFCAGAFVGLAPTLALLYLAPGEFLFGNFGYAELNTLYRAERGYTRAMTLPLKLAYLVEVLAKGNFVPPLVLAMAVGWRMEWRAARAQRRFDELHFLLFLFPFLLIGAFGPSPSWPQYHYVLMPFIIIGIALAIARIPEEGRVQRLTGIVVLGALLELPYLLAGSGAVRLFRPAEWTPLAVHRMGDVVRREAGDGARVLTLAPIVALEGGTRIYPQLATGVFAWRTAHLVEPEERTRFGMIAASDVAALERTLPPDALLLGWEREEDEELRQSLAGAAFRVLEMGDGVKLYERMR